MNASVCPSGETAGPQSPNESFGGHVNRWNSPVARDTANRLLGSESDILPGTINHLLSGDQLAPLLLFCVFRPGSKLSNSLRGTPPNAGTSKNPIRLPGR